MIFTSLSPNTQFDDFLEGLKALLNIPSLNDGRYGTNVQQWFQKIFNIHYCFTYESARSGLYFLFKTLGIKKGDEVIVQAFTCVAVVNPIRWVGAEPVFVDIEPKTANINLLDLQKKISAKTKAVIVQHTFGYPAEIDKIKEEMSKRGVFVIEDCAHTIGTLYKGKLLGTWGDAGLFSFGRDKAISGSFGGVIITKDKNLGEKLELLNKKASFPPKSWTIRQLLYTLSTYISRELYDVLFIGKVIHYLSGKLGFREKATTDSEKKGVEIPKFALSKLPNALARVAFHQLQKINQLNKRRLEIMRKYQERLRNVRGVKNFDWKLSEKIYLLRFPLIVENRDKLLSFARKRGAYLDDWYSVPVAPKEVHQEAVGYIWGSCPNAEKLCKQIINLPLHINMSDKDVEKVVEVIKEFYLKFENRNPERIFGMQ
jgi:perosamine synthetase